MVLTRVNKRNGQERPSSSKKKRTKKVRGKTSDEQKPSKTRGKERNRTNGSYERNEPVAEMSSWTEIGWDELERTGKGKHEERTGTSVKYTEPALTICTKMELII